MTRSYLFLLLLAFCPGCAEVEARPAPGSMAPAGSAPPQVRMMSAESDPRALKAGRIGVLLFISTDCPIANGYAPQIHELVARFAKRPVDFHLVHVDPDLTIDQAQKHAEEYGHRNPILLDRKRELVNWAGATITPEAVVFDAAGTIHYRGRINNWYGDIGRKRVHVSKHELRDAVEALLAGDSVKVARAPAVGCTIEPLRP